jgi:regulator of sirC expression with transglutaminase-like and TPR domain
MLQNLHSGYLKRNDWTRGVQTLDLLVLAAPAESHELAAALKLRGLLLIELKRFHDARRDFEKYLKLEPQAADREQVEKQISAIHRWLARVN